MSQAVQQASVEAVAMRMMSEPTMLAVDIDPNAAPPPQEGTLVLVDMINGHPMVAGAGWSTPLMLHQPPSGLFAIVAGKDGDKLPKLMRWLRLIGAQTIPPVVTWTAGNEEAALAEATRHLVRQTAQWVARGIDTARQASELKAANTELRYRFALAETSMLRHDALPFELVFTNEPSSEPSQYDVLNESGTGLTQVLPVASGGVAAIGLHFGGPEPSASRLELRLNTLEDGRTIERWSVPARAIVPGWNLFGMSRVLSGLNRTLQLELLKPEGGERLPAISLGAPQALPVFQVGDMGKNTAALPSSVAVKIWRGLPGTRLSPSIMVHRPLRRDAPASGFIERPIATSSLRDVELANADAVSFDFRPVWAPPGENTATCHPPSHGVTLGRLPEAVPAEATKVSASIAIGDERSHDVDFALVVADHPARALQILQGGSKPAAFEAFSGWVSLGAAARRRIFAFRAPGRLGNHLFIATRMSQPGDNSYAQARFKDFFVMVRG
jgi:hypothetical protein